jgi:hypothetical protein
MREKAHRSVEARNNMVLTDFEVEDEFYFGGKHWRVTDIGWRVVIAIDHDGQNEKRWFAGSRYVVAEMIFDESDLGGCSREPAFLTVERKE